MSKGTEPILEPDEGRRRRRALASNKNSGFQGAHDLPEVE